MNSAILFEHVAARQLTASYEQLALLPMKIQRPSWAAPNEERGFGREERPCSIASQPCQEQLEHLQQSEQYYDECSFPHAVGFPSIEVCPEDLPTLLETNSTGIGSSPSGASGEMARTTVMVLNIPFRISRKGFTDELNNSNWNGAYNFCNLPHSLSTGKNLGFSFVNFNTVAQAEAFSKQWTGLEIFGRGKKLKIRPAKVQGILANLQLAQKSMNRRNTLFKPLLSL